MKIKLWIARREQDWKRLDSLLQRVEKKGLKSLSAPEIREFASLYRSVCADLARAQTHQVGNILQQDLKQLTVRSYSQIYQGSRRQEWEAAIEFCRWGFPELVQQTFAYIALAMAIFGSMALVGWWYGWQDPVFLSVVLPESMISQVRDKQELWTGSIVGIEPWASSNIMVNNLSVSFAAVAGGITAGIYTTFILALNGLLIGTVGALVGQYNLAYPFWAFVFPHGSLELPAIFFAGGAGLLLGRAILFPGRYRRVDALKHSGSQAVQLLFGVVPMLIVAGIIEGFFSPNPVLPDAVKYFLGIVLLALLVLYCRRRRQVSEG